MKLFVINLEKHTQRRQAIIAQLEQQQLHNYEIIKAVDGKALSQSDSNALVDHDAIRGYLKRPMATTEIGCILSHLACYQRIIDDKLRGAVILEDDAILSNETRNVFGQLDQCSLPEDGVILLFWARYISQKPVLSLKNHSIHKAYREMNGHAYYISRASAQQLLTFHRRIKTPLDHWQHYVNNRLIKLFSITPPIAISRDNNKEDSAIENERKEAIKHKRHSVFTVINHRNPMRKTLSAIKRYITGKRIQQKIPFK